MQKKATTKQQLETIGRTRKEPLSPKQFGNQAKKAKKELT